jgi:hypothetical protein
VHWFGQFINVLIKECANALRNGSATRSGNTMLFNDMFGEAMVRIDTFITIFTRLKSSFYVRCLGSRLPQRLILNQWFYESTT